MQHSICPASKYNKMLCLLGDIHSHSPLDSRTPGLRALKLKLTRLSGVLRLLPYSWQIAGLSVLWSHEPVSILIQFLLKYMTVKHTQVSMYQ